MVPQKETTMVLTVDLECNRCFIKVKRALCSLPQVRDQIYNEKENTVTIKVTGCCPERIRDKLCTKCGKSIKFIEIKPQKKVTFIETPIELKTEKPPGKQPQGTPPEITPPANAGGKRVTFKLEDHQARAGKAPPATEAPKPAERAAMMAPMVPASVYGYGFPVNVGCLDCYEGRMCGYHGNGSGYGYGYGVPPPPPPAGGYGYGHGYGYGYKPSYYGDYVSDANASGCRLM